jgi:hypothetical protein
LIIDLYLSQIGALELLVVEALQAPQRQLGRGIFNGVQLVPARLDNADGQTELVGLIRAYERETLVGELNPHTVRI